MHGTMIVTHGALLSFPWKADKPKLMVQHAYTLSTSWEWDVASTLRPNVAKLVLNAVLTVAGCRSIDSA